MQHAWAPDAVFYHLYPLGAFGAPAHNDGRSAPVARLAELARWIPHWQALGVDALYLGPVFESSTHGYDTLDYGRVDRRLGTNETLAEAVRALHAAGIRVILDGVLNHVGRDFWAFQDVRRHQQKSRYRGWFSGLKFDPLRYDTWAGHDALVKLDLDHPEVRAYLFDAVAGWIDAYGIDGLRLDAADVMDLGFLKDLAAMCRARKPDFWLVGEVVHGDYAKWANPETLDATTNYWCYKGLWSSHNDRNYHEIAWALDQQFGPAGKYRGLPLYAFVDNHDVDRIASQLTHLPHLFPLHVLLFTMPGVPSIYYGSEWATPGKKARHTDAPLRPRATPPAAGDPREDHALATAIGRLARVRRALPALRRGDYRQIAVSAEQLVFERALPSERVRVAVNAADAPRLVTLDPAAARDGRWVDVLNPGEAFRARRGAPVQVPVHPTWGRVLRFEPA